MYQLFILVGIILLYLLFRALRKARFSIEILKSKTEQKKPSDVLALFYKETHTYPFVKEKPLFLLSDESDEISIGGEKGSRGTIRARDRFCSELVHRSPEQVRHSASTDDIDELGPIR